MLPVAWTLLAVPVAITLLLATLPERCNIIRLDTAASREIMSRDIASSRDSICGDNASNRYPLSRNGSSRDNAGRSDIAGREAILPITASFAAPALGPPIPIPPAELWLMTESLTVFDVVNTGMIPAVPTPTIGVATAGLQPLLDSPDPYWLTFSNST
jgi:hypothetical protein